MRNLIFILALISQLACTKEAEQALNTPVISVQLIQAPQPKPVQGVAVGQCWMRQEDVGLNPSSYSIRKITAINATKYSYFPILQGYRLNQTNDYLSDLTEKFQLTQCPESFNE